MKRFIPYLLLILFVGLLVACSNTPNPPTTNPPTTNPPTTNPPASPINLPERTIPIEVNVPIGDSSELKILTPFVTQSTTQKTIKVTDKTLLILKDKFGNSVGYSLVLPNQSSTKIDAKSSALALLQMHPAMWGTTTDFSQKFVDNAVRVTVFQQLVDEISANYANNLYDPINILAYPKLAVLVNQVVDKTLKLPELKNSLLNDFAVSSVSAAEGGNFKASLNIAKNSIDIDNPKTVHYVAFSREHDSEKRLPGDMLTVEGKYGLIAFPLDLKEWPPRIKNPLAPVRTTSSLSKLMQQSGLLNYDIVLTRGGKNLIDGFILKSLNTPEGKAVALNGLKTIELIVQFFGASLQDKFKDIFKDEKSYKKFSEAWETIVSKVYDAQIAFDTLYAAAFLLDETVAVLSAEGKHDPAITATKNHIYTIITGIEAVTNIKPKKYTPADMDNLVRSYMKNYSSYNDFKKAVLSGQNVGIGNSMRALKELTLQSTSSGFISMLQNINGDGTKSTEAKGPAWALTRMVVTAQQLSESDEFTNWFALYITNFGGAAFDDWLRSAAEDMLVSLLGGVTVKVAQGANTIAPFVFDSITAPGEITFYVRDGQLIPLSAPEIDEVGLYMNTPLAIQVDYSYSKNGGNIGKAPVNLQERQCFDLNVGIDVPQTAKYVKNALFKNKFFKKYNDVQVLEYSFTVENSLQGDRSVLKRSLIAGEHDIGIYWNIRSKVAHASGAEDRVWEKLKLMRDVDTFIDKGFYPVSWAPKNIKFASYQDDRIFANAKRICAQEGDTSVVVNVKSFTGLSDTFTVPISVNGAPNIGHISKQDTGTGEINLSAIISDDTTAPDKLDIGWTIKNWKQQSVKSTQGVGKTNYAVQLPYGIYSATIRAKDELGLSTSYTQHFIIVAPPKPKITLLEAKTVHTNARFNWLVEGLNSDYHQCYFTHDSVNTKPKDYTPISFTNCRNGGIDHQYVNPGQYKAALYIYPKNILSLRALAASKEISVSLNSARLPVPVSPTGTVQTLTPRFVWRKSPDATIGYKLIVVDSAGHGVHSSRVLTNGTTEYGMPAGILKDNESYTWALAIYVNGQQDTTIFPPRLDFKVQLASVPSDTIVHISAGGFHSLALKANGTVGANGWNRYNQATVSSALNDAIAIAAGGYHSMVLRSNGKVVAWGRNVDNQASVPSTLNDVSAVAAGTYHSLALKKNGLVNAWGRNTSGQTNVPTTLNNVIAVAAGGFHSLALKRDGTVVAWGDNSKGQSAVLSGLKDVVAIAAGGFHSLALKRDGTIVAWGDNSQKQTAVPSGLRDVVAIATGGYHSLALKRDGTVVAWGRNVEGQTDVPTNLQNITAISAGAIHSLVLDVDGKVTLFGTFTPADASNVPLSDDQALQSLYAE